MTQTPATQSFSFGASQTSSIFGGAAQTRPTFGMHKGRAPTASVGFQFGANNQRQQHVEDSVRMASEPTRAQASAAQVGQLVAGTNKLVVDTRLTGVTYNYNNNARPLCIGLAVWRDLKVFADSLTENEAFLYAREHLHDSMQGSVAELVAKLSGRFVEEQCIICTDTPSAVVFFQCGHQCTCAGCAKKFGVGAKCCMCRASISALIPVEFMK